MTSFLRRECSAQCANSSTNAGLGAEPPPQTQIKSQLILTGGLALSTFNKKGTTHMRKIQTLLIAFMFALTGCPDGQPPSNQYAEEQKKRKEAEAQRDNEAASKAGWQAVAFITGIGAVILLITGTIMGSRARHYAKRRE